VLGIRASRSDCTREVCSIINALSVEEDDDISFLQAGFLSCGVFLDLSDQSAFVFLKAERFCQLRTHCLDHYTQTAAVYFTVFDEFVFNLKRQINRNSEGQAHKAAGSREDLRVNADDFSLHIEKRTAGVARVDGGVSLNERDKLIAWEVTALSRDDTARDCVL